MDNNFLKASLSYFGLAETRAEVVDLVSEHGEIALLVRVPLTDVDVIGIAGRMRTMIEDELAAPEPALAPIEVVNEQRLRDEYNAMDKRTRSEFGAFHRYKAWRLGQSVEAPDPERGFPVELSAHVYLSPAEATPQQKAMAIGRDEKGNYAIAVEDLTDLQYADHVVRPGQGAADIVGPTADQMRQGYINRTMAAHARLNGADGKPTSNADDFGGLPG